MKKISMIFLVVFVALLTCICATTAAAADTCSAGHLLDKTVIAYYYDEDGIPKYSKTVVCYGKDCKPKVTSGNAGSTNTCIQCGERTLAQREIFHPTCVTEGYTEFECAYCGVFVAEETNKIAHNYKETVVPATCEEDGYTLFTCNCSTYDNSKPDKSYKDNYILKKGHNMEKPGTAYTYVYNKTNSSCVVYGQCADCTAIFTETSAEKYEILNVIPDSCPHDGCGINVSKKIVSVPANCEASAEITYSCENGHTVNVKALPVGHVAKTTTYTYSDGVYVSATVDCYRCGIKTVVDETYKNNTKCEYKDCTGVVETRVVTTPTCSKNGNTKVKCSQGCEYIEASKPSTSHNSKVTEWVYDYESGQYTMKASCRNYGCNGYYKSGSIGVLGKCPACGKADSLVYKKVTQADCGAKECTEYKCVNCCQPDYQDAYGFHSQFIIGKQTRAHNTISDEVAATCLTEGSTKTTCVICYHTRVTANTPALGHLINVGQIKYTENKNSTDINKQTIGACERTGCPSRNENTPDEPAIVEKNETVNNYPKCAKCGGYSVYEEFKVAPDCAHETNGYTRIFCKNNCRDSNDSYIVDNGFKYYYIPDSSIVAYGHRYSAWKITKSATCSEKGLREKTCSLCNGTLKEEIPAYTYVDEDGNVQPNHEYIVLENGKAATCTEPGMTPFLHCTMCDAFVGHKEIAPTGHKLDTSAGAINKNFCVNCNSYILDEETDFACSCMHHNTDGLAQLFFRFIIFFCKIFGINQVCECGAIHY